MQQGKGVVYVDDHCIYLPVIVEVSEGGTAARLHHLHTVAGGPRDIGEFPVAEIPKQLVPLRVGLLGQVGSIHLRIDVAVGHEDVRSEEHTSELQSRLHLVCRLLLEKKKKKITSSSR